MSTTNQGLWQCSADRFIRRFGKQNGLQSSQFIANAIFKASDGRIYVGTNYGFNSFLPYKLEPNRVAPRVMITDVAIMNRRVEPGCEQLPQALYCTEQLNLDYNDKVLTLYFSAMSYCMPQANRYAYKLEGFDKDWNYTWHSNRVTYTNLSPGNYKFLVKGTNNDGLWSENVTTLSIVISPPFYLSLPMKLLYVFFVLLAVFLSIQWMLRRSESRHKEEMARLKEDKEKEVREAKISFFTMVAHEIRTPVSLIIGPLENLMKQTASLPNDISSDLNVIDRNAHRLLYLVNQLLDFRKAEQKSLVSRFALCNISKLIDSVCERFEPSFKQNQVTLVTDLPDESFSAVVDSEAITKVISNLLSNASKYTKDRIELSCKPLPNGEEFEIRVSDNGKGVRTQDIRRIFQPFYQATGNMPGTGIGLNIVKGIVESHHGKVWVESAGEGQGSSFIVQLPIRQNGAVLGDEAEVKPDELQPEVVSDAVPTDEVTSKSDRPTVLVVEDNEDMNHFLVKALERTYHVLSARDGQEALECIEKSLVEPSLILSDWMMPRMDGEEFCRKVRANQLFSHIPFILLTAKTDTDSKVKGMDCGADVYIEKPFSLQYVEACIANIIAMREKLKQKFSTSPMEPVATIAPTPIDNEFLTALTQKIEANFSNPDLSVNFLAEQLSMSRSTLFAKIKSLSGTTPNEMIMLVRLKRAAVLLREGKLQINEICYMVGFSSPSYFSKCFQKQFGIKPGEFKSNPTADVLG